MESESLDHRLTSKNSGWRRRIVRTPIATGVAWTEADQSLAVAIIGDAGRYSQCRAELPGTGLWSC